MNRSLYQLVVVTVFSVLMSGSLKATENPQTVSVSVKTAYIPVGYDTNDNVQIALTGLLPNACHRVGPAQVKVDEQGKNILVHQQAYQYSKPCLELQIPFTKIVDAGILTEGSYTVVDETSGVSLGTVEVKRANTLSIDDYLYAPITDATVIKPSDAKNPTLVLDMKWTNRCTRYKDTVVHEYKNVIVVQPIAEALMEEGRSCETESVRFQVKKPLSENLKGTYLLHVRSMDGQALNKIIDID